ncbi:MAG: hypothetical protein ACE5PV_13505 [Candidatus Poribacteria bacterium]
MDDRTRDVGPRSRPPRARKTRRGIRVKRDKSLLEIAKTQVGKVTLTEDVSTDNKWERLKTEFKQIDWDKFIDEYHEHSGHWAIVPRVIFFNQRGITQTFKALALLVEEFMGSIWDVDTKHEYTQRMIEERIIQARGPINKVSDAHARIRDNLFRYLGLAFLESGSVISESHITEVGSKFLKTFSLIERKAILEGQLIKLHFWNPVIPRERYGNFQVRPFALLLQLLIHLDAQSLSSEEYNLFLSRAQSMKELEITLKGISQFRQMNSSQQTTLINQLNNYIQQGRQTSLYHEVDEMRKIVFSLFSVSSVCKINQDRTKIRLNENQLHWARKFIELNDNVQYRRFTNQRDWYEYYGRASVIT